MINREMCRKYQPPRCREKSKKKSEMRERINIIEYQLGMCI